MKTGQKREAGRRGSIAPGFLVLSLLAGPFIAVWADSSGAVPAPDREWRDEQGRLLKRVDRWGGATLFTHDEHGRLVRIDSDKDTWTHLFIYGDGLVGEIDCSGRRHEYATLRKIDQRTCSALAGHHHIPPAKSRSQRTPNPYEAQFEYDATNRLKEFTTLGFDHSPRAQ